MCLDSAIFNSVSMIVILSVPLPAMAQANQNKAAPKEKQAYIDRILEHPKITLEAADLQAMNLDRIKEIYRTLKPKEEAVGWKRGTLENLRGFYTEKVLTYYMREQDSHCVKRKVDSSWRWIFEADVLEEMALTGTTAAKIGRAAARTTQDPSRRSVQSAVWR